MLLLMAGAAMAQGEFMCGDTVRDGNDNYIAKALASDQHWFEHADNCAVGNDISANNASGFNAIPGGYRIGGYRVDNPSIYEQTKNSYGSGTLCTYWTSTCDSSTYYTDPDRVCVVDVDYTSKTPYRTCGMKKSNEYSVKCLRDN